MNSSIISTPSTGFAAYVLRRVHVAHLRAQIFTNEIGEIEAALKGGLITPECALLSLDQCGAMGLIPTSSAEAARS